jgi:hypothetical protein
MEKKNSLIITKELFDDVQKFCNLNKIDDVDKFLLKCLKQGVDIEKYGLLSYDSEKIVEVIKEIEKVVEVPVEKIIEVVREIQLPPIEVIKYVDKEIIKEVPVEKIVEKIVNISDNSEPIIVEKIIEVPVEKIVEVIKEVEKPNEKTKLLEGTLQNLKKELNLKDEKINQLTNKIKELENLTINTGAVFMRGSNISQNL